LVSQAVTAEVVLFDFDGTLVDPRDGLLDSFVHGLAAVGVAVDDKHDLEPLVGPPIHYGFHTYLGLTEPSLSVAVAAFREYLGTVGVLQYAPYPGIVDLLDHLVDTGRVVGLVTSKPLPFVELVIAHVGLAVEFAVISAASLDGSVAEKVELVERALRLLRVPAESAVMVGDREFDILGAEANGVQSIGVLWGYGSRAELEAAGADLLVESVAELRDMLLATPS
jgi:phosphoglycolate phosphatase